LKSVGGQSLVGGTLIYNDKNSRSSGSKGFGGRYEGDLNAKGERVGYGVFVADNGNRYEGEWKNDKRDGHGEAKYTTGDVYIGSWKNANVMVMVPCLLRTETCTRVVGTMALRTAQECTNGEMERSTLVGTARIIALGRAYGGTWIGVGSSD
jgi:hypothetical protein